MEKHVILLLCIICILSACQKTPEQNAVVNKGDGQMMEIIESTAVITAEIEVNERWETSLQEGKVYINIDAEIIYPDVEAYPVLSIVPIIMNQELADKALEAFFKELHLMKEK